MALSGFLDLPLEIRQIVHAMVFRFPDVAGYDGGFLFSSKSRMELPNISPDKHPGRWMESAEDCELLSVNEQIYAETASISCQVNSENLDSLYRFFKVCGSRRPRWLRELTIVCRREKKDIRMFEDLTLEMLCDIKGLHCL